VWSPWPRLHAANLPILLGASVGQTGKRDRPDCARFVISFSPRTAAERHHPHLRFRSNVLRNRAAICCWASALDDLARAFEWLSIRIGGLTNRAPPAKPRSVKANRWLRARTTLGLSGRLCRPCSVHPHRGRTSKDAAWQARCCGLRHRRRYPMLRLPMRTAVTTRVRSMRESHPAAAGFGVVVIAFAVASLSVRHAIVAG